MECFRDYIGLSPLVCVTAPGSNIYITSLPGLSLESVEKSAKPEQVTALGVYSDVQTRAFARLEVDTNKGFALRYQLKSLQRSLNLGRQIIPANVTAKVAGKLRGFYNEMDFGASEGYVSSTLQQTYVQSLSLYLTELINDGGDPVVPSPFKVYIIDVDTGTVLLEKEVNTTQSPLVVGWNVLTIEAFYNERKLLFCYEAELVDGVELNIPSSINNAYCDCIGRIYGDDCCGKIYGAETTGPTVAPTKGNNAFGLSGIISIVCNYTNILCNNKALFRSPLLYLLGAELLIERIYTNTRWAHQRP